MVGTNGIEPSTSGLGDRCSVHLSYVPIIYGASSWIRTNNVYPEGLVLQTNATPPSLPSTLKLVGTERLELSPKRTRSLI